MEMQAWKVGQLPGESTGSDQSESKLRSTFHRWGRTREAESQEAETCRSPESGNFLW